MSKESLIISADSGINNVAVVTISLFAVDLDVKMIVSTWGNASLEHTLQNIFDLEGFLHTEAPVTKGTNQPLVRPAISAASVRGKIGTVGSKFEEVDSDLLEEGLITTEMCEEIKSNPEKVTLLGIGSLTDFALLFGQYPNVVDSIAGVYITGGSIGHGNHSPFAEYSAVGDPRATQAVFHSGLPVCVAPLEIGDKAHLTKDQTDKTKERGEVGNMLYSVFSNIRESDRGTGTEIYDPTAIGTMLHSGSFTLRPANAEIELIGRYTYGASVMDLLSEEHNVRIATNVGTKSFTTWSVQNIRTVDNGGK